MCCHYETQRRRKKVFDFRLNTLNIFIVFDNFWRDWSYTDTPHKQKRFNYNSVISIFQFHYPTASIVQIRRHTQYAILSHFALIFSHSIIHNDIHKIHFKLLRQQNVNHLQNWMENHICAKRSFKKYTKSKYNYFMITVSKPL